MGCFFCKSNYSQPETAVKYGTANERDTVTSENEHRCVVQPFFSPENEPWCLDPSQLGHWFSDNVQCGTKLFDNDCREAIDMIVRHIHSVCSKDDDLFDVCKVIKGGSLGKGTMLKDFSDVDLVAFINPPALEPIKNLSSPEDYRYQVKCIIDDLEEALRQLEDVTIIRHDKYLINFEISLGLDRPTIWVDLLPTADNCDIYDMYREMDQLSISYDRELYSASLVKFQRDFVKNQPGRVKELIRLVKYWAYTCLPKTLQKSYPLELITIHRWEKVEKPGYFSIAQGLKEVLGVLANLKGERAYWEYMYDKNKANKTIRELRMTNPIVLDPANPYNNVCRVYHKGDNMKLIQDAAKLTLESPLLKDVDVCRPYWSDY